MCWSCIKYQGDTMDFLEQIKQAKETNVEFTLVKDTEQLKNREFASEAAYLLQNMIIARENVFRECGLKENVIKKLEKPSEKMKHELRFIAAVCEELLKE